MASRNLLAGKAHGDVHVTYELVVPVTDYVLGWDTKRARWWEKRRRAGIPGTKTAWHFCVNGWFTY
jgi:hypothetical protein